MAAARNLLCGPNRNRPPLGALVPLGDRFFSNNAKLAALSLKSSASQCIVERPNNKEEGPGPTTKCKLEEGT